MDNEFVLILFYYDFAISSIVSMSKSVVHKLAYNIFVEKRNVKLRLSAEGIPFRALFILPYRSNTGWICFPCRAASIVSGILVKSATREQGFKTAESCPKGTK